MGISVVFNQDADLRVEPLHKECDDFIGVVYVSAPSYTVVQATANFFLYRSLMFPCGPQLYDVVGDVARLGVSS